MTEQFICVDNRWIRLVKRIEPEPINAPRLRLKSDSQGYYQNADGSETHAINGIDVTQAWNDLLKQLEAM
jgi:hypothetical protein